MTFQQEIDNWLDENCPASMRTVMSSDESVWGGRRSVFPSADAKLWLERMARKGYLAPTWSKEFGGAALSKADAKVLQQQLAVKGCRPALMSLGIHMMGPTIMEFGSREQQLAFLPDIAHGKIRWCQGYSEPGAGSDLASLQCKAEKVDGGFEVTGQKVWTSFADKSDFLFCLVRTDFSATKHDGISVLLIDMASSGVSVKPIELISGNSHFCEVFLDSVFVPEENLLGPLNKGWDIAKRMLQHERNMMGQSSLAEQFDPKLEDLAKRYVGESDGKITDAAIRDKIAANLMQVHCVDATGLRVFEEMRQGQAGGGSSVLKIAMTLAYQDKYELLLQVLGSKALGWQDDNGFGEDELRSSKEWAFSKVQTIGGGTTEVQYNIIAKRILQLPE